MYFTPSYTHIYIHTPSYTQHVHVHAYPGICTPSYVHTHLYTPSYTQHVHVHVHVQFYIYIQIIEYVQNVIYKKCNYYFFTPSHTYTHTSNLYTGPQGINPINDSSITVSPGDSVTLNWLAYDINLFKYIYTDSNGDTPPGTPGTLDTNFWSPPCVAPILTNPNMTFVVPILATISIAPILTEEGGNYVLIGNDGLFNSSIQVTGNNTIQYYTCTLQVIITGNNNR